MNFRNEWRSILENANKQLEKHGAKIIVNDDEGCFNVQIQYADGYINDYAENFYENELDGCLTDALDYALKTAVERKALKPKSDIGENCKDLKRRTKEHLKEQTKLSNDIVEAIYDMCMAMGGEVVVDTVIDSSPLITYDGGHHAEYNSTIYGVVCTIRATKQRKKKCFEVDLEQEENYSCKRMTFDDVCQIFDFVCSAFDDYTDQNTNED